MMRLKTQELVVRHFDEHLFACAFEESCGQTLLLFEKLVDAFLDRAATHKLVNQDIVLLPDAESAIGGLILDRGDFTSGQNG